MGTLSRNPVVRILAAATALSQLCACASQDHPMNSYAMYASWKRVCHGTFTAEVDRLARTKLNDCGFIGFEWTPERLSATSRCATDALNAGIGFKTGYSGVGDDGTDCHALIVVDADHVYTYYRMYSPLGSGAWVRRCERVEMNPSPRHPHELFATKNCVDRPELVDEIIK